jgi:L-threonylcarbamoyladenylate synthase
VFRHVVTSPDPAKLAPVVHALRSGAVVVLLTDTIYGLSARFDRPTALRRIAAAKGRGAAAPYLLLIGSLEELALVTPAPPPAEVADLVWPGPVTLLMTAREGLPSALVGEQGTVAVRHPDAPLVRTILAGVEHPIVSTSVNRSGEEPLTDPDTIARRFGQAIDVLVDAGPLSDPRPSTIIDLTRQPPALVRQGRAAVDLERLARCMRSA